MFGESNPGLLRGSLERYPIDHEGLIINWVIFKLYIPNMNYSRSFPLPYSLERMEEIPLFFLCSIYIYLRISRNREIIHIPF